MEDGALVFNYNSFAKIENKNWFENKRWQKFVMYAKSS